MSERPWLCPQDGTCPALRHDTWAGYKHGCRSGQALADDRKYRKLHRHGLAPVRFKSSVGVRRRLQALAALGHSFVSMSAHLDCNREWVSKVANGAESLDYVRACTFQQVDAMYRRLSMVPGTNKVTKTKALKRGWTPPLAWTNIDDPNEQPDLGGVDTQPDENVVAAVLAGRATWASMTRADQEHLVSTLFARGWETAVIADRACGDVVDVRRVLDSARAKRKRAAA